LTNSFAESVWPTDPDSTEIERFAKSEHSASTKHSAARTSTLTDVSWRPGSSRGTRRGAVRHGCRAPTQRSTADRSSERDRPRRADRTFCGLAAHAQCAVAHNGVLDAPGTPRSRAGATVSASTSPSGIAGSPRQARHLADLLTPRVAYAGIPTAPTARSAIGVGDGAVWVAFEQPSQARSGMSAATLYAALHDPLDHHGGGRCSARCNRLHRNASQDASE
jgi:hypothetical protein